MQCIVVVMSSCQIAVLPGLLLYENIIKIVISTTDNTDPTNVLIPGLRKTENGKKDRE